MRYGSHLFLTCRHHVHQCLREVQGLANAMVTYWYGWEGPNPTVFLSGGAVIQACWRQVMVQLEGKR